MTIIVVDDKRVGDTRCYLCQEDVTLAELAIGNAYLTSKEAGMGHKVVHALCMADLAYDLALKIRDEYQSPYGDDEPF